VARKKTHPTRVHRELEHRGLARREQLWVFEGFAEPRSNQALGQEVRRAVRVDVDQPNVPVRVTSRGRGVQTAGDPTDDVERLAEGRARVAEAIVASRGDAVVDRALLHVPEDAQSSGWVIPVRIGRLC